MYEYKAEVIRVIDGDTVHLMVDLGMDVKVACKCRLWGINAPELNTQDGKYASAYLAGLLSKRQSWIVKTFKDKREKYGRYLVSIYDALGELQCVNDQMVADDHAVRYMDT